MADNETFLIRYDGDALRDHTIDADDLASALLGLNEFIEEGNRVVNDGRASIRLRVKATNPGCFQVAIIANQSLIDHAVDLLTNRDVQAVGALLGILGFTARDLVKGAIEIVRRLGGKKPRSVKQLGDNLIELELPDGTKLTTTKDAWEITVSKKARKGLYRMVKPLEKPGIDSFEVRETSFSEEIVTVSISKDEAPAFVPPELVQQVLATGERDTVVRILSLWFKPDNKWKFSEGGNSFSAVVTDAEFLGRIARDEISFKATTLWKVHLKQTQLRTPAGLKSEYEVTRVGEPLESEPDPEQPLLLIPDDDEEENDDGWQTP